MVNSEQFTSRLKKIMDFNQLSASLFADKVGVQRSSISHILSGRNKPSLDFVLKVVAEFKDVNINWLLKGEGIFPDTKKASITPTIPIVDATSKNNAKKIKRIVVFYEDGTFDEYKK